MHVKCFENVKINLNLDFISLFTGMLYTLILRIFYLYFPINVIIIKKTERTKEMTYWQKLLPGGKKFIF